MIGPGLGEMKISIQVRKFGIFSKAILNDKNQSSNKRINDRKVSDQKVGKCKLILITYLIIKTDFWPLLDEPFYITIQIDKMDMGLHYKIENQKHGNINF